MRNQVAGFDSVPSGSHSVPDDLVPGSSAEPRGTGEPGTSLKVGTKSRRNQVAFKQRNVRGNSGDPNRGKWCTPKLVADAVGRFDHDPFSNPHSHIVSDAACWLERGDDGFGDGETPGSYRIAATGLLRASSETRVWIQPPYSIVMRAFNHYQHTRWAALLRFDPRPEWFDAVYDAAELVCVLREIQFEPPPGVRGGTNSFPHAIYYRHAEDATDDILKLCINWKKKPR